MNSTQERGYGGGVDRAPADKTTEEPVQLKDLPDARVLPTVSWQRLSWGVFWSFIL